MGKTLEDILKFIREKELERDFQESLSLYSCCSVALHHEQNDKAKPLFMRPSHA